MVDVVISSWGGLRRSIAAGLVLVSTCLGLVACGGHKESQQEAEQHLCQSLDNFSASILSLQGLSLSSSSQEDVKAALDKVTKAWDQVVTDAKDVKNVSTDSLQSTYNDLKNGIQNRPTDKPVSQVIAGLQPQIAAFTQAWQQLTNGLDCKKSS
jgi:hypothetical protein